MPLSILDVVLKASAMLLLAGGAAAALRRASAATRHFVWTLGIVGSLASPALSFALPSWNVPLVRIAATAPAAAPVQSVRAFATPLTRVRPANILAAPPISAAPVASVGRLHVALSWSLLLVVWVTGLAVLLTRLLLGLAFARVIARRSARTDAPWVHQARDLARSLGVHRVRFLQSRASSMPMALGIARPSIVLPKDADGWPAERRRIVLLHELAHVKRRDCLTHVAAQVSCAVYWFNPLVWMASRRMRVERERACDDLVLSAGTRGSDYAEQLLDIARVMNADRVPAVLGGASLAMAHRSQLEGRLMAILDPSIPRRGPTRIRAAAGVFACAALALSVAVVEPWAQEQAPSPTPADAGNGQADVHVQVRTKRHVKTTVRGSAVGRPHVGEGVGQGVGSGTGIGNAADPMPAVELAQSIAESVSGGIAEGVTGLVTGGAVDTATAIASAVQGAVEPALAQTARTGERHVDRRTVNALVAALKDSDADVREQAAFALGQLRDAKAVEALVGALKDASDSVREQAAFALGQIGDPRAIDGLTGALKDTKASVRQMAAFALGQIR